MSFTKIQNPSSFILCLQYSFIFLCVLFFLTKLKLQLPLLTLEIIPADMYSSPTLFTCARYGSTSSAVSTFMNREPSEQQTVCTDFPYMCFLFKVFRFFYFLQAETSRIKIAVKSSVSGGEFQNAIVRVSHASRVILDVTVSPDTLLAL